MNWPFNHNAHMAETMWLHYDSIIHGKHTSKPQKQFAIQQQQYWEAKWIRYTMHTHPINQLLRSVT